MCENNVAGERNRRRDCDFVFECLLDLLEDALGNENENNRCRRVCRECRRCRECRWWD